MKGIGADVIVGLPEIVELEFHPLLPEVAFSRVGAAVSTGQ